MEDKPNISVIIPAYNEEDTIGECLISLEDLDYPSEKLEIILINDGSSDNTKKVMSNYNQKLNLVLLETDGVGPSKARNIGLDCAKGEYVAFIDADCAVDREWLNELLKGFITEDVAGVGGSQIIPVNATEFEKKVHVFLSSMHFVSEYMKEADGIEIVQHVASCNAIYKTGVVREVQGFDDKLWPGEDVDLDYKITHKGYKIAYNPKAIVMHHRPKNLMKFYYMMKRYGGAQAYLIKKHGLFRKLHYVPILEVLVLLGLGMVMVFDVFFGVGLGFLIVLCAAMTLVLKKGIKHGLDNFWMLVITLIGWNLGFGIGLISMRKT
jgi:cellulose synthase/poly-beta-1,6-N-acetylglucosamine synthase-like glycosyltransferase